MHQQGGILSFGDPSSFPQRHSTRNQGSSHTASCASPMRRVLQLQIELVEEGVGESGAAEETREIRNRMQLLLKNVTDFERKLRGLTDEIENLEREKEQQCQKYEVLLTTKENSKQRWNSEKVNKTSSDTDQDLMDLDL